MNYDPNLGQEHGRFEKPQEEMPLPPDEAANEAPPAFLSEDADILPEREDSGFDDTPVYHGKFAARSAPVPAEEPGEAAPEAPQEPELPAPEIAEDAPAPVDSADSVEYNDSAPFFSEPQEAEPWQSIPEELPPPEPVEQPQKRRTRAVKKGRPRRKKGEGMLGIPNILVTGVWVALTVLIGVTLGRIVWVCASEVLAFGREDKSITITIDETDTIDDITWKLARNELIHYPGLFKLYAKFAVDDGEIKPGMWELNTKYDYHALVKMMSPSSSKEVVKIMIPEGYSCRQIFALLQENKVCTVQSMEAYAASGELNDYWFLDGVARGDRYCLEGFLFPDTYEFYQNDSPKNVLTKMLNNFNTRFDEEMRGKIQVLNNHLADLMRRDGRGQDYIDSHLFTVRDVVNVASMIEKESASAQESYTIASVIYNRLFCWHGTPAYLNIDATIIYALDGKTDLTAEDLRVDSPYNTYTNIGLTPGPISNPGLSSLKAALEPADTSYYFYVLDPTAGTHVFAATQEEHDANRARLGG